MDELEFFLIILLLLATIGLSNIVNHFFPFVPVPLIQIGLGIIVSVIPLGIHVPLDPDYFLLFLLLPYFSMMGEMFREQHYGN